MTFNDQQGVFDIEGRPTFDEVLIWRDALNGEFAQLDEDQEGEEGLYFQRFDVEAPGGKLAVKTGSAPSDADAAVDSLVPPDISVQVKPAKAKEKYRKQADKLARMGKGLIFAWRKRKDFVRKAATDMVIRRVAVARVMYDDSAWIARPEDLQQTDMPVQNEGEADDAYETRLEAWEARDEKVDAWEVRHRRKVPIVWQTRSPRHVRWREDDDTGEILVVVEHRPTKVIDVLNTYRYNPVLYESAQHCMRGLEATAPVMHDEVWIGRYRCIVINDEPLFAPFEGDHRGVQKHEYPEIPYIIMPFRELTFEEMELRYRGMLSNGAQLYEIESNVLTMQVWMLAINAWRTYLGWTKNGREIEIKPGQYIPIDERIGEYLRMLEGQPVPDELLQTSNIMDGYIQRNSVAQGPTDASGTRSAQQLWAVQSMRTLKLESAKNSLTMGITRGLEIAAAIIDTKLAGERLTLPIPGKNREGEDMGEVTVSSGDIDGYWDGFIVSLGRRLDPALLEQWTRLQALAVNKWMPERVSYELSGATDNPQEWIDEKVREAVDALPFVIEEVGLERVKNWFGEDSERFIALSNQLRAQQQMTQKSPMAPQGGTQQPPGRPAAGGAAPEGGNATGQAMGQQMRPRPAARVTGRPTRGGSPNGRPPQA